MTRNKRILVIEPEAHLLQSYAQILSGDGFEVHEACSGRRGLEIACEAKPALVLVDLALPDVCGLEVCRQLKHEPRLQGVQVAVLYPKAAPATQTPAGLAPEADDYIATPVSRAELLVRVRTLGRLRDTAVALRESEERYRQLAENIREVFWMTDVAKGRMLYISPAYEEIWGRSCASLYASPRDWIEALHPEDRERVREAALAKQASGEYDELYRIVRPDGSVRWIQDRAFPVRDEAGRVYRLVGIAEDITRRKQAEEALKESQARRQAAEVRLHMLAQAVESSTEPICITDLKDRFVFVNQAFERTYGYTQEEILGKTPAVLLSPQNPPSVLASVLEQAHAGGWEGELLDRRKDGTEFPIRLSTSQIKDVEGRVIGLIGVAQDITERKRAEKQHAAFSQMGHRLGAAMAPEEAAAIILDIAAELFQWDAAWLVRYSRAEDRIFPVLAFDMVEGRRTAFAPAHLEFAPTGILRQVLESGSQLLNESTMAGPRVKLTAFGDPSDRTVSRMFVPIRCGGEVVGILSVQSETANAYSPSDLKLLQSLGDECGDALQRIKVAEALVAAEARYRSIFEHATEGIFQTTPEGRLLGANPALVRIFGYASAEEMVASVTNVAWQIYVRPEQRRELQRLLEARGSVEGFQAENYRKDGSVIWISLNAHAIRNDAGVICRYEGTLQDITERKRLEKELLEMSANERRRIGHELHDGLGQYLAGIAFRAKALEQTLGREASRHTPRARELTTLVSNAIRQTRSVARGFDPVQVETIGLPAALQNLATEVTQFFNLDCVFRYDTPGPKVEAQTGLTLYRMTQEAIHNAIRHGEARSIQIKLAWTPEHLVLLVQDDGAGFNVRERKQTGMGLRVMEYRAGSIGARLLIDSQPGRGTRLRCEVPRARCLQPEPGLPGTVGPTAPVGLSLTEVCVMERTDSCSRNST